MVEPLVFATWVLVAATALLVIANAIPAVSAIVERRKKNRRRENVIGPKLHFLKGRLARLFGTFSDPKVTGKEAESWENYHRRNLDIVHEISIETVEIDMHVYANILVAKHFISHSAPIVHEFVHAAEKRETPALVRQKEDLRQSIARQMKAAELAIERAEAGLPSSVGKVGDQPFMKYFETTCSELEAEANKYLVRPKITAGR